jgi:DNA (cytosine-5)-methyltransferase 1
MIQHELVVDNFAGGGGASTGIEAALSRSIDYAINHDPEAIAMHRANHPGTHHFCESVWDVNPRKIVRGRRMGLGWFSPDCTFHSKARGAKPFRDRDAARRRRGLAGIVFPWIHAARPRVIMLENVEEFQDWGPLLEDGRPCPERRGLSFRRWHRQIENLGYQIDMRELRACDYGAPTTRKRLFIIARRDGQEIVFPEAAFGPNKPQPYRTAAECIDWSVPCPSIFGRARPLADNTMRRIARGVMRYVVNNPRPFIVPITHRGDDRVHPIDEPLRTITTAHRGEFALIAPALINTRNGERPGQAPRVRDILEPYPTVTAIGSQGALVAAFLARHYGGHENDGASMEIPFHTITARDHHSLVTAFLLKYYGTDQDPHIDEPIDTITTKARFGLVTVCGEQYRIVDIGMRMLTPRELYRAQSFPDRYIIEHGITEHGETLPLSKTSQIRMCGNSVAPVVAEALVRANLVEQAEQYEAAVA